MILLSVACLLTLSEAQAMDNEETVKKKIGRLKSERKVRAMADPVLQPQQPRVVNHEQNDEDKDEEEIVFDPKNPRSMDERLAFVEGDEIIFVQPKKLLSLPKKLEKNEEQNKPNRYASLPQMSVKHKNKKQAFDSLIFLEISKEGNKKEIEKDNEEENNPNN